MMVLADLGTKEGVEKVFDSADSHFEKLDILINNATLPWGNLDEGTYTDWEHLINTNLLAYLACSAEAMKRMKGDGHIVNIGSMSADVREETGSLYVATKSGIQGWIQMNFKDADSKDNFALKHYHENYGYDLNAVLSKHPIKELDNNSHKEDLMNSLKKGNLQSATFIKDGQEVKQYLEATPQFKTLTVYDADMKRLDTRQAKEQGQSQGTGEGKSQDSNDEDGPGETQEKKQRRKKQSL